MKFLIIGASGFVGSHILEEAKSIGYTVLGTESKNKNPRLVKFNLLNDRIKDCVDKSFFKAKEPIFGIICAFVSQIDTCFRDREKTYKINVEKIIQLIKDFRELNVKPVFQSTSFVFNGKDGHYNEESYINPICEYGRHKVEVENYIKKNVPEALIIRTDKIVGSDPKEHHLFSEWYNCIKEKKPIICIAGQLFSPTYVEDVARSFILCCEKNLSGVYHVVNSESFSREELANQFLSFLGEKGKITGKSQEELGFLDYRPLKTYLDSSRFIKETNFRFTPMRDLFNKFKQNLNQL